MNEDNSGIGDRVTFTSGDGDSHSEDSHGEDSHGEESRGEDSSNLPVRVIRAGDRQLFQVKLRPGKTTYLSWKKFMKEAKKPQGSTSQPAPPPNANPNLETRIAPSQPADKEQEDQAAPPRRFSAVIEKIERLYMGKDSSDEEGLDNAPDDDDEYDTEDSFIDDAELDEYFEVDDSAIKHDGFFVNRGKLERKNESPSTSNQQPKKIQIGKANGEIDKDHVSSKLPKLAKQTGGKITPSLGKNSSNPSQKTSKMSQHSGAKVQNQSIVAGIPSRKKIVGAKGTLVPSSSVKISNGSASSPVSEVKSAEKLKPGILQPRKVVGNKSKEATSSDALHKKNNDKSVHPQSKSQPGKPKSQALKMDITVRPTERSSMRELPDDKVPGGKYLVQATNTSVTPKKDGSRAKPKASLLEREIGELERMVANSRPPAATENQEADTSQAIKRRLPREVKQKLAKVARTAASQGKVSEELINRLMTILGHLMQLRTLKRNLKVMINMGLSAKEEQNVRFQQLKKEVTERIKTQLSTEPKEKEAGISNDFQEGASDEKGSSTKRSVMDTATEDKICDLYDIYLDGLDEDAGPQIRKLYVELANLWPKGLMDNYGIKSAICRSKERKRVALGQEKMKRKKTSTSKPEDAVRPEAITPVQTEAVTPVGTVATTPVQTHHIQEKPATVTDSRKLSITNKQVSGATASASKRPNPPTNEKPKGSLSSSSSSAIERKAADGTMLKKMLKRKPEVETSELHNRPEKIPTHLTVENPMSLKQAAVHPNKPNPPAIAPSSN